MNADEYDTLLQAVNELLSEGIKSGEVDITPDALSQRILEYGLEHLAEIVRNWTQRQVNEFLP